MMAKKMKLGLHTYTLHLWGLGQNWGIVADPRPKEMNLFQLMDKAVERTNQVRLIMLVWSRAHQKMASGVVDPADWFDIKDAPALLIKYGSKML